MLNGFLFAVSIDPVSMVIVRWDKLVEVIIDYKFWQLSLCFVRLLRVNERCEDTYLICDFQKVINLFLLKFDFFCGS